MIHFANDERGDYLVYSLEDGRTFSFDQVDREIVGDHDWKLYKLNKHHWYAARSDNGQPMVLLHRAILGFPKSHVDHANGDSLNNRRYNLRPATVAQNAANKKNIKHTSSGYRRVYDQHNGWYHAIITIAHKARYLGRFRDPIEAAKVGDKAAYEAWGEFAILNFPLSE